MRTLHAINQHESPLARGQYSYARSGQILDKTEAWNLHHLPDGSTTLRADANTDSHLADNAVSLLAHLLNSPDGTPERLHIRYETKSWKAEVQVTFFPDHAIVSHSVGQQAQRQFELELPKSTVVVAPCLAINVARAFDQAIENKQRLTVLGFGDNWKSVDDFTPRLEGVDLEYQGAESIEVASIGTVEAVRLVMNNETIFHVDAHGVLLQQESANGDILVTLNQYTRYHT